MKKILTVATMVLLAMTMMFCEQEEGPRGVPGADGEDGADGKDGNANVITYLFTDSLDIAWGGSTINFNYDTSFTIPDSIIEEGVILVYKKVKSFTVMWYPVPGLGYNGLYVTRLFIRDDMIQIRAYDPDGSSWSGGTLPELSAIKIILIPSSTVINMKKSGANIDFKDYEATMDYFDLKR
jgi:hypothetical protein